MTTALFLLAAVLYLAACLQHFVLLARGSERAARIAVWTLGAAAGAHGLFVLVEHVISSRTPSGDIHDALAFGSLIIVLSYLSVRERYRIAVLGAFIAPVTLVLFIGSAVGHGTSYVPRGISPALMPLHVGANILGLAAFALAFATAVAYLIQERLLRRKQLGGLFKRLPSLDILDSFGLRLVTIGFPLLTLGIITGAAWAARADAGTTQLFAGQWFAVLAWVFFAAVLALRAAAGWRGRRAAIGTILGFISSLAVLAGYVIRSGSGVL